MPINPVSSSKEVRMYKSNSRKQKSEKIEDLLIGDDMKNTPFLRTLSNNDMFSGLDASADQYEWTKFKGTNADFHSLSHTTLVPEHNEDQNASSEQPQSYWPFVFESDLQISTHEEPAQKPVKLNDIEGSLDGYGHNLFPNDCDHQDHLQSPLKTDLIDTMKYLGEGTFSTSFVEKVLQAPQDDNFIVPNQLQNTYLPPHAYHNENFYWSGHPEQSTVEHMWQEHYPEAIGHQTSISSFETLRSNSKADAKIKKNSKPEVSSSNRRRTMQQSMDCNRCFTKLGIAFIRGLTASSIDPTLALCCKDCQDMNTPDLNKPVGSEKKRKRKLTKIIECEVCHHCIGFGGVHSTDNDLKVEYVCTDCGEKYMFCSECGGGGKQRTGKWRPRELFEHGRRTCSLPHIRVGSAEIHYRVIPIDELTSDILQGIQDVFFDCMLSLYCIPTVMTGESYPTFGIIKQEIERLWLTSVLDVLTNNVLEGRKFVTVAWIEKRHRNKGVGRSNVTKGVIPWLQRLGLSGIIPAPKPGFENPEDQHHCFVAFSIVEWDIVNKTLFMAQMAPRSVFLKTMEGYQDLIKKVVEYIRNIANIEAFPSPEHIWCWAKADHARLQSIPSRLKFQPRDEYLASNPNVDPRAMERPNYEPLFGEGTFIFAAATKYFISKNTAKCK